MNTEKPKPTRRSKKRSRSGAHQPCPHCGKKLRGEKGLKSHIEEMHPEFVRKAAGIAK